MVTPKLLVFLTFLRSCYQFTSFLKEHKRRNKKRVNKGNSRVTTLLFLVLPLLPEVVKVVVHQVPQGFPSFPAPPCYHVLPLGWKTVVTPKVPVSLIFFPPCYHCYHYFRVGEREKKKFFERGGVVTVDSPPVLPVLPVLPVTSRGKVVVTRKNLLLLPVLPLRELLLLPVVGESGALTPTRDSVNRVTSCYQSVEDSGNS